MTTNEKRSRSVRTKVDTAALVLLGVGSMAQSFGAAPSALAPTAPTASTAPSAAVRFSEISGARRFVVPGVAPVRVEVRVPARSGGTGCGGGGCSLGIELRALQGALPAASYSFYFPDDVRHSRRAGCPSTRDFSGYFSTPRVAEIAPTQGPGESQPDCGFVYYDNGTHAEHHWVLLRVQR